MTELKPLPCKICGREMDGKNDTWHRRSNGDCLVICPSPCGEEGPDAPSFEEAVTAWNTRDTRKD